MATNNKKPKTDKKENVEEEIITKTTIYVFGGEVNLLHHHSKNETRMAGSSSGAIEKIVKKAPTVNARHPDSPHPGPSSQSGAIKKVVKKVPTAQLLRPSTLTQNPPPKPNTGAIRKTLVAPDYKAKSVLKPKIITSLDVANKKALKPVKPLPPKVDKKPITVVKKPIKKGHCCPICLVDPPSVPVATKCGHIFCKKCISKCLILNFRCPVCSKMQTRSDLIRVYLNSGN